MAGDPTRIQHPELIRGRYHDRYHVVCIRRGVGDPIEELGRMALISPYVIDTRIQRLRFVVGDIIPALSRKNRSNEGIERERESCYPLDWLPNRGVTLLSTHKKNEEVLSFVFLPVFPRFAINSKLLKI